MSNFFLQKNFTKPGETVEIKGSCILPHTIFSSGDEKIAVVQSGTIINVVGIGEAKIYESSGFGDCDNGTQGILLTSTEDGKPFFMSLEDYNNFTNYEGIFLFFLLLSAFLIRFAKRT